MPIKSPLTRQQTIGAILLCVIVVATATFVQTYISHRQTTTTETLFPFDPNTADSLTLSQLGLEPWRIQGILKYRNKGGRYRQPEDFRFNMDSATWARYQPFVQIDTLALRTADSIREAAFRAHWDSVYQVKRDSFEVIRQHRRDSFAVLKQQRRDSFDRLREERRDSIKRANEARLDSLYPHRHKIDTVLELNTADTITLQMIAGVGPAMARWIINYRDLLRGYYSPEQIREIRQIRQRNINVDSILPHLTANPLLINKINIHTASLNTLRKHPYLQPFEKAKSLYEWRQRHTRPIRPEDLGKIDELTEDDCQKIQIYFDFQ